MKYALITLVFALFISCTKDDEKTPDYNVENEQEIIDYIANNNLTAQKSESGLYYVINELGAGAQPSLTDNVTLTYKGYFTNGSVFDEQGGNGIDFNLQQLVPGFAEGITYFKEGGNGIILLPSKLAYGDTGFGPIPPGAVLIFDIGLISVN